jgi:aryl-alcohol dehydrogenase-like predicted oxidoreductase
MQYRKHQNDMISEIGVGCYALSGAYGHKDPDDFKQVLRRAYELGVNFFDTADTYGDQAEQLLGEAIKPFRQDVHIASKVGIREGVKPNLSAEYIKRACAASLERLQIETIDLYQVHFDDPDTPVEETLSGLEELAAAGMIRHFGLGHLATQRVKEYIVHGNIFSVLMELSGVARGSRDDLLPLCREHNIGAIAFSVTGRGILTGKIGKESVFEAGDIRVLDPLFQRSRFISALRIANKFEEVGSRHGKTPVQTAIAWVLSQPGIICALTGPSTIPHLEENVAASGWQLGSEDLEKLEACFEREDEWLFERESLSIRRILIGELDPDPTQAFTDLIYAIEASLLLGLSSEGDMMPTFMELFELRDELSDPTKPKLKTIQEELRSKINLP